MMDALIGFAKWLDSGQGWLPVLLDAAVKATMVLGLGALAVRALGRASAAARHAVWTAAIVGSLTLPLLPLWLPQWRLPVLPATIPAIDAPATDVPAASARLAGVHAFGPMENEATAAPRQGLSGPATSHFSPVWAGLTPSGMLLAVWAGVAGILLLRLAIGHASVRRIARTRKDQVPWLEVARGIVAEAGVTPVPAFVEGPADAMPMTWGILRPVVMLPSNHVSWPAGRLRVVLLHELAHVARRDCLTQLLANLGCALYWFNPLSWLAASRLASERERACDEWVVAAGTDGPEYAEQLLEIARAMRPARLSWSSVSMARRSQLEGRLLAILDPRQSRRPVTRVIAGATVAAIAIAVPILAAVRPATVPVVPDFGPASQEAPAPMPSPAPTPSPRPRAAAVPEIEVPVDIGQAVAAGAAGGIAQGVGRNQKHRTPADPKVIEALTLALKDSDDEVREQALFALGRLGDVRAAGAIAPMLTDSSAEVREHAAVALGQMRDPAAVEPLLAALRDNAPGVREQAAFALAQFRDPRAVEPLIAALGDATAGVREQACFALAQLRDKRATPKLVAALEDSDRDVREQAAFALAQVRDPVATSALAARLRDADAGVREQAVFALSQVRDPQAVEPLIQALGDEATDVQAQAAFALGQSRDRRAVAPLVRALQSNSPEVRAHAAWALGQLRDPSATDALMAAIKDANAEVRKAAAFALSQLTEP